MPLNPPPGQHVGLRLGGTAPPGQYVALHLGATPDPPGPITRTAPDTWGGPRASWSVIAQRHRVSVAVPHLDAPPQFALLALPARKPPRRDAVVGVGWLHVIRRSARIGLPHQQIQPTGRTLASGWFHPMRIGSTLASGWSELHPRVRVWAVPYLHPGRQYLDARITLRTIDRQSREWRASYVDAPLRKRDPRLPWGDAAHAPWHVAEPETTTPPPPPPVRTGRHVGLALACPVHTADGAHVPLMLGRVTCRHLYPRRRTYSVLNFASIVRLPDRVPVQASSVSLAIDASQFAWSVSIDIADRASFDLVQPVATVPREVEITINGYVWTAVVDGFDESAGWNAGTWRVSGRSRAAYLAEPYAPTRSRVVTTERLAQQLAALELAGTDWALDWTALDWVVPADVWTFDGLRPLEVIQRIAASVGAWVHADRALDVLHVRPTYPHAPWLWGAESPVAVILPDYALSRSGRFEGGVRAEQVIVRGQRAGVQARVLRAGTAGVLSAGVFVDPLITTFPAAQARGIHELARTGPRQLVDLELPLFPEGGSEPGLIEPAQLVLCDGAAPYRAVTTACRVTAQRTGAALKVRQTLSVERHYDFP